jgi:hypothetical protein
VVRKPSAIHSIGGVWEKALVKLTLGGNVLCFRVFITKIIDKFILGSDVLIA